MGYGAWMMLALVSTYAVVAGIKAWCEYQYMKDMVRRINRLSEENDRLSRQLEKFK